MLKKLTNALKIFEYMDKNSDSSEANESVVSVVLGCLHSKLGVNVLPQIGSEVLQSNEKNHSNISTMDNFASGLNVPVSSTDSSPGMTVDIMAPADLTFLV
ncbi:hypothetical protein TNCT_353101 [Trichonephila clavata]|uniref:Uncharacterized protein n=1 Tax=Trichonephila clavata TaxID=2740835 RepID=A0A8X6GUV9_TRICU|nr:hypothetical protein TNCT_353101 [Trichonephila clavata]